MNGGMVFTYLIVPLPYPSFVLVLTMDDCAMRPFIYCAGGGSAASRPPTRRNFLSVRVTEHRCIGSDNLHIVTLDPENPPAGTLCWLLGLCSCFFARSFADLMTSVETGRRSSCMNSW